MCRYLVMAVDRVNSDSAKNDMLPKTGDLIVCMPDDHVWGAAEGLPTFWQIDVPGMTVADGRLYCGEYRPATVPTRYRAWSLNLPAGVMAKLASTGRHTVSNHAAMRGLLRHKITGLPA